MKWRKLGRIFVANFHDDWMKTHGAWPKAYLISEDVFRIYFSVRDRGNRSSVAYVDIDIKAPTCVQKISLQPFLLPGSVGHFDDCGVIPSCIVSLPSGRGFYYVGISRAITVPFRAFCGLALIDKNLEIATRISLSPIIERSEIDPISGGSVFIIFNKMINQYIMWYESCLGCGPGTETTAEYTIKTAYSTDGLYWTRTNTSCFSKTGVETYFSNPSVIFENKTYKMWYSYKIDGKYRIGYAESADGLTFDRMDDVVGITLSESGWDSEEIEYPHVFDHKGERYMLYCGNGYGKTGFGIAVLERE